jgi:hypothetical protein
MNAFYEASNQLIKTFPTSSGRFTTQTLDPNVSQIIAVHTFASDIFKVNLNAFLQQIVKLILD